jgi:predicted kinase
LRFADPVADIAFLVMELKFHGRNDLAGALTDAYFRASGDDEGRMLVSFYSSYRAAVRAKVEGLKSTMTEIPEAERAAARARARGYWLMALEELEQPNRKPCLVLVGGLPGTGKSTLAADLAERGGFSVIRSDVVRKQLAGVSGNKQDAQVFERGDYAPDWNDRTYRECLRQAETLLFDGKRVVVDASFREEAKRRAFLEAAARWKVPAVLLLCQADPNVVRERLANRRNDASDANWSIYLRMAESWEEAGPLTKLAQRTITAVGNREHTLEQALAVLRNEGLQAQMAVS